MPPWQVSKGFLLYKISQHSAVYPHYTADDAYLLVCILQHKINEGKDSITTISWMFTQINSMLKRSMGLSKEALKILNWKKNRIRLLCHSLCFYFRHNALISYTKTLQISTSITQKGKRRKIVYLRPPKISRQQVFHLFVNSSRLKSWRSLTYSQFLDIGSQKL